MLTQPTIEKLKAMKLSAMAQAFMEQMQRPDMASLTFEERFGLLVDQQMADLDNRRMQNRLRTAKLRLSASSEDLDFRQARGMNRSQVMSLAQNQWVRSHQNILITGPTGAGKSYLACALAQKACRVSAAMVICQLTGVVANGIFHPRRQPNFPVWLQSSPTEFST